MIVVLLAATLDTLFWQRTMHFEGNGFAERDAAPGLPAAVSADIDLASMLRDLEALRGQIERLVAQIPPPGPTCAPEPPQSTDGRGPGTLLYSTR